MQFKMEEEDMSEENYHPPRWFDIPAHASIYYWPGGNLKPGVQIPLDKCKCIRRVELQTLLPFLFDQGYLNTFLTKQSRDEDLKITHRILNVLEHEVGMKNQKDGRDS